MDSPAAWAPNPYTVAQLLADQKDIEPLYTADGTAADDFLRDAFLSQGRHKSMHAAFSVFQGISELGKTLTLADALNSDDLLAVARKENYTEAQLGRVLPAVMQISDALFGETVFAKARDLTVEDVFFLDPVQGDVGDCYLISALIALAWTHPELLRSRLNASGFDPDLKKPFTWNFHLDAELPREPEPFAVTSMIPMAGKLPRYARSILRGEFWPGLIEKAYVIRERSNPKEGRAPAPPRTKEIDVPDYQAIAVKPHNTTPPLACQALVGGVVRGHPTGSTQGKRVFEDPEELHTDSGVMTKPTMAWTKPKPAEGERDFWDETGLWANHAYAVLGVTRQAEREFVVLRNPWGIATKPRPGFARDLWKAGDQEVTLNEKGVFAIERTLFHKHFRHIGWLDDIPDA